MLVLGRKVGEQVYVGSDIVITIVSVEGRRVRLGITAPEQIPIHREEVRSRADAADALRHERLSLEGVG